ncbi:MAG TPA: phosphatase PAP2 family protein [Blastocatellia bacterium]|nr:phosphatase PAP2 family protein [Blastocatellia bacterium]
MVQTRGLAVKGRGRRAGGREFEREGTVAATRETVERAPESIENQEARPKLGPLSPADKVVIAYLAIVGFLILLFSNRIEHWGLLCAGHVAVIVVVTMLAKWDRSSRPALSFAHGWYPILLIGLTYKELTYLIPRIHPRDFDAALAAIDYRIFGVNPTVWLERFTWPPLTEVLQLTYSTYYFLPIILGAVLWGKGWFDKFYYWVFLVLFGFYLSYLGYVAVPAIGPRFLPSIVEAQTKPLIGVWLFLPVRQMLDNAEGLTRDCFPSGHTEVTLLVLYYAHRFHRKVFWWFLPFGIGIIISTVYLRYHYVVDVVAGAVLALIVIAVAKPLHRLLDRRAAPDNR